MAGMLCETNRIVRPDEPYSSILPEAPALELGVADGEHLVDEQDLGLEVRSDRERKPDVHAARIALDRRVDELLDPGELDDGVEVARDLLALHPQDGAVQEDVLASGELGMKARADLEQAADAPPDLRAPPRRRGDPRQDLQQRRLARAVLADDPEDLSLLDLERDVVEGPDLGAWLGVVTGGDRA